MSCYQEIQGDGPSAFCQWLLARPIRFLEKLLIGDEAAFQLNGEVNTQNVRQYAPRGNRLNFVYDRRDSRQKWTVWIGLCGNGLFVGAVFFDGKI